MADVKKLEEDVLFKQIGSQLDSSKFDYSQWQRTGKPADSKLSVNKVRKPIRTVSDQSAKSGFVVSGGAGSWFDQLPRTAQTTCCHGRKPDKKQGVNAAYEAALAKKKAEQMKILQLRIRARKQTIAEYRKREAELLLSNMSLKEDILTEEKEAHEDVKKLLRKYEKYRGGINTLNDQFGSDLGDAKHSLEETRKQVTENISSLQKQVDAMDDQLKTQQNELTVLLNYKDKEYPVKSLRISELQTEIAELKINQQEDQNELQYIVETEVDKFRKEEDRVRKDVTEKATEEVISKMHPSLRDMALQNLVMAKELEFHAKEIADLEDQNATLDVEVKDLLHDPKTSIRRQMFPEFFYDREKCTPDMEVVLDIPTQHWLPI